MRHILYSVASGVLATLSVRAAEPSFRSAEPVWPAGEETRLNAFFRFKAEVELDAPAVLRVTAGYDYRAKVNGAFLGFGPARAAKGFFRVDEWPIAARGRVAVEIDSAGYNCRNYYLMKQMPFLQAEIVSGGRTLAATGRDGAFRAYRTGKVVKTMRYTGQRTFLEAYRVGGEVPSEPLALAVQPAKRLLERGWPYPDFAVNRSFRPIRRETMEVGPVPPDGEGLAFIANAERMYDAYGTDEVETDPFHDLRRRRVASSSACAEPGPLYPLDREEALLFEGDRNEAGFIGLRVRAAAPVRILLGYDEVLTNGVLDIARPACANALEWRIEKPGEYELETFEPYNMKFARVVSVGGRAEVSAPWVRTYKSPLVGRISFRASDPSLGKIFDAAKESLAGNSAECLTDCPGRERAGWIGDTFFTGRTAALFTGSDVPERMFLDNYLRPAHFEWSPRLTARADMEGMVPALYPGDTWTVSSYIPTYAMWFVLQVEEHCRRSGDAAFLDRCRDRILGILRNLRQYENADGLLENLAGWVFVDWSIANKHVQNVNYPSNMLYAKALDAAARMYAQPALAEKAEKIRAAVRSQSWDGAWFHDNAQRRADGSLKLTDVRTEACQYYAFYTGTADRGSHEALWNRLVGEFGPDRVSRGRYPEIAPCNFLYGACLRLELLSAAHRSRQVLDETKGYFLPMAERTGTLWENLSTVASCYHGFSSYVGYYLYRDVLGIREIDRVVRRLTVEPPDGLPLEFCEGTFPVSESETARIAWRRKDGRQVLEASLPDGWRLVAPVRADGTVVPPVRPDFDQPNYDEAKIAPYALEDPLVFADGRKVRTREDWAARRREILDIFAREMYGAEPPPPEAVVTELFDEGVTFGGFGIRRQYRMWLRKDRTGPAIDWLVILPRYAKAPAKPILFLNYGGNHELLRDPEVRIPEEAWVRFRKDFRAEPESRGRYESMSSDEFVFPAHMIVARGYALVSACYAQVSPDTCNRPDMMERAFSEGVFTLWPPRDPSRDDNVTSIGAWAWALSRGLDLAERIPELDAKHAVATGYSRLGKTALLAAARDERFAACVPNQTGGGGVPLAKRDYGENIGTEMVAFPYWYCRAYAKYARNPAELLTFDQHLLLAAIAPRALFVQGFDSRWFDTKGEFLALRAASPAWRFLGGEGLPDVAFPDDFETSAIGRDLAYVRRPGYHGHNANDWTWLLDFADRAFGGR